MATEIETILAPSEALEELEGLQEQLNDCAKKFVTPAQTIIDPEKPIELFLEGAGHYFADGKSVAKYFPHFKINGVYPERSFEVENHRNGERGWIPPTRTITVPSRPANTEYRVHLNRKPSVGLVAVHYSMSNEYRSRNLTMPYDGTFEDAKTQELFGKAFTLTAIAHSLDPERIVAI